MKTKTIAYYLYFVACLTALFAIVIDSELLLLLSKPMIIPAVYFYYLTKTRTVNFAMTMVMLLNFAGDTIILLKITDPLFVMVPYFLSYLILIGFLFADIRLTKFSLSNLILTFLVAAGHVLMLYLVLDLQSTEGKRFIVPFTIYGITLSSMVTISVYNYLAGKTIAGFYLMIATFCCLVSDVFYVLYNEHFHLPILSYINSGMQFFTYIFLIQYILNRKSSVVKAIA
ncbi:lysoplasmalogenase family protein [Flavobacterium caeni]|uniref:YhhN-like protein n=1 Tax=Flavobacterium caeni TaxID=490189 RepID=A0A1G5BE84_9FLAO|nr:lysoplasmalogenase family protein [Flavobacterium caeni]SCX88475.1 YhhN-like protein [Flavobacterium caeni]